MNREPLRREPGPRDWTPGGGYVYDSPATTGATGATSAGGVASRGVRAKRPRRTRPLVSRDHGFAALIVGVVAIDLDELAVDLDRFLDLAFLQVHSGDVF